MQTDMGKSAAASSSSPLPDVHDLLVSLGYYPQTGASNMVHDAISGAFALLGESCADVLVSHLSAMHRMPRHVLMSRYDLVSKAIKQTFGYGSEVFLHGIRNSLLESLPHVAPTTATPQLIEEAYRFEALMFAGELREGRTLLLWTDPDRRQQVIDAFFKRTSPAGTAAFRGTEQARYDGEGNIVVGTRAYSNLVSCHQHGLPDGDNQQQELLHHRHHVCSGSPARAFLCTCLVDGARKDLREMVMAHDHVLTDRPFMVYSKS